MRAVATLCLFAAVLCIPARVGGFQQDAPQVHIWLPASPLGIARYDGCAIAFSGNRILVAGGVGADEAENSSRVLESAEIYLEDRSFQAAPNMLRARSNQACALLQDGRILVVGGRDNAGNAVNSAEIYDPVENGWRETENLPLARWGQSASVLANGLVLLAGGEDGQRVTEALELFNPYTNTFEVLKAKLTSPRRDHGAALLPDGAVLFTGGFDGAAGLSSTDRFDLASGTIQPGPEMPGGARYAHSAVSLVDGSVFVAGGITGSVETASSLIFRNGAWTEGPRLRDARSRHAALRIPNNGTVLIAGGVSAGAPIATSELYGSDGVLVPAGPLTIARTGLHLAAREDGVVLAAGGFRQGSPVAGCGNFLAPTIVLNRARYVRGQTLTVTGQNWPANRTLTLSVMPGSASNVTVSTSSTGAFTFSSMVLPPVSTSSYKAVAQMDATSSTSAFSASAPYRVIAPTTTLLTISPASGSSYGNQITANVEVRPEIVNGQMAGVVLMNNLVQVSGPPQPPTPFVLFPIASVAPLPGTFARNVNEFGFFAHPINPSVGLYNFQAVYQENDFYASSTSPVVSNYPIGKAPVTLSLSISPDPPVAGTSSVVTVTANSPSLNSGNLAFRPQGLLNLGVAYASGGSASGFGTSLDAGNPPRGSSSPELRGGTENRITANYPGSSNHLAASASLLRTPLKATPVLAVTSFVDSSSAVTIPMDPSPCRIWIPCRIRISMQRDELFSGVLTMQPPASVTGFNLASAALNRFADFVVQASPMPGVLQFGFDYSGDTSFNPASTIARLDFAKIPTVLTIKAAGVALPAQGSVALAKNVPVTFDIEMTGVIGAPAPSGKLEFSDFTGAASTQFRLVNGFTNFFRVSFTKVYSRSGPATLTFRYPGDPAFLDRAETRTIQVQ